MNNNNPNVNKKDDDLDLSSIINEYEEDSVLRQKIEKMKQQKAQEEALEKETRSIDSSRSALNVKKEVQSPLPKDEDVINKSTFLDADDSDKTREINVNGEVNHDVDKTLVIMDNQHSFDSTLKEEKAQEEDESILVYANHEVDEEEITEEDIEEFLGEEEIKKNAKKEIDPKKMNKMITYVISGVVGLCLLVGVGFGLKFAMDSFGGNEKASDSETIKDNDTSKDTEKDKDKEPNNDAQKPNDVPEKEEPPKPQSVDNSVKIAEINGSIKANNEQINDLNAQINEYKNKINALGYKPDSHEEVQARTDQLAYPQMIAKLTQEHKDLQTTCDALTKNPEEGKDTQAACQQAAAKKQELEEANKKLAELNKLVDDYKSKNIEYNKYNEAIAEANRQITDLNNKNTDLQRQLSDLQ